MNFLSVRTQNVFFLLLFFLRVLKHLKLLHGISRPYKPEMHYLFYFLFLEFIFRRGILIFLLFFLDFFRTNKCLLCVVFLRALCVLVELLSLCMGTFSSSNVVFKALGSLPLPRWPVVGNWVRGRYFLTKFNERVINSFLKRNN